MGLKKSKGADARS